MDFKYLQWKNVKYLNFYIDCMLKYILNILVKQNI